MRIKVGDTFVIKGTKVKMEITSADEQRFYGHYISEDGGKVGSAILEKHLLDHDWFVEKIYILN